MCLNVLTINILFATYINLMPLILFHTFAIFTTVMFHEGYRVEILVCAILNNSWGLNGQDPLRGDDINLQDIVDNKDFEEAFRRWVLIYCICLENIKIARSSYGRLNNVFWKMPVGIKFTRILITTVEFSSLSLQ